ncbi:MAG: hypothetical protein JSV98_06950 [candidate division WOR-3 bacterium]|nr:MAG: hypothetical protein JSV98_06950 [candidate division WOR-3 bacterium]
MARRDVMKNLDRAAGKHEKRFFAGIRTRNNKRQLTRTKRVQLRDIGMVWDCSVLCLARCGPRIYVGPL